MLVFCWLVAAVWLGWPALLLLLLLLRLLLL
jgi:hypothetical protein